MVFFVGFVISLCVCKYIEEVNTLYGTGGFLGGMGADPAGVQQPFGMVRAGPDSVNEFNAYISQEHAGGFYASDKYIRIFSHIHMVGPGVEDYGNIGVMPYGINDLWFKHPDFSLHIDDYNYKSTFDIKNAEPGYFNVDLLDSKINVELTSTTYVGVHRYTFRDSSHRPYIFFYISHSIADACKDSQITMDVENQEVSGMILNAGGLTERIDLVGGVKIYFVAKMSRKFDGYGVWEKTKVYASRTNASGTDVGGFVSFSDLPSEQPVEMYVSVSFISIEQARKNLQHDIPQLFSPSSSSVSNQATVFDRIQQQSQTTWETQLSKVKVHSGGTAEQIRTFYSALYRTLSAPTLFRESNGVYLGFDQKVHQADHGYYSDLSIWDVFRSQFPLLSLLSSDVMLDIIRSLVLMFLQGGDIPRWAIANGYTGCMIGQHATVAIVDAYLKNITDFDVQTAYKGMRQGATQVQKHAGREIGDWVKYGFIPLDNISQSVCHTLAYSYDDGALSVLADRLGYSDDAKLFHDRSKGFTKVFDPKSKFFCPKSSKGEFDCPTLTTDVFDERYIEGDAWHWRFFVPHDIPTMIELFGGNEAFAEQLEIFVKEEFSDPLPWVPNRYFWVGNEHNLLSPWLGNYAGRPDLTQKYIRQVIQYYFNSTPDGVPGNDDFGETSSWMVFAAMGFYPTAGSTLYSIGTPIFQNFEFSLGQREGCVVNVTLDNYDQQKNFYIEKIFVNGKEHDLLFFDHIKDFLGEECPVNIRYVMTDKAPL